MSTAEDAEHHVEATGETVGEAKWQALRELEKREPNLDKSQVRFQVVSEGERGLLGVGYSPARVVATVPRGAPVPPEEPEPAASVPAEGPLQELVADLLTRITSEMGVRCRIEFHDRGEELVAVCSGPDLGLLIGKHGGTIDSIQYLVNAIAFRRASGEFMPVVVDAAGYRARREVAVHSLAVRTAERVLSSGRPVELDPMSAAERKLVHVRLKEFEGVETTSEGTEPHRFVIVSPAGGE